MQTRAFPDDLVIKARLPMQWAWMQSLVRELRSYMPHGMARKKERRQRRPLINLSLEWKLMQPFGKHLVTSS